MNLHYKNRQPELFLLFKLGLREKEREEGRTIVITRAYKHQVWRRFTCARERQAKQKQKHTHTPTQL